MISVRKSTKWAFSTEPDWRSPPKPTLTLYVWRTQQIGFGIIWSSFGFRCQPIDEHEQEQMYQRVRAAALGANKGQSSGD